MSMIIASTTSPTASLSETFAIRSLAIWLMWIKPSTPGMICAKAPKVVIETILTGQMVSMG